MQEELSISYPELKQGNEFGPRASAFWYITPSMPRLWQEEASVLSGRGAEQNGVC